MVLLALDAADAANSSTTNLRILAASATADTKFQAQFSSKPRATKSGIRETDRCYFQVPGFVEYVLQLSLSLVSLIWFVIVSLYLS